MGKLTQKKQRNISLSWHLREQVKTLPDMGRNINELFVSIAKKKSLTQCIRGGMERIVKSMKKVKTEDVYDITVEGEHHYILGNGLVSHNSGLKYAASTIIYLSKKKEKDGTEVVGNLIKAKTAKSRLSKENKDVTVRLYYDERGLDRYYGLLELGELGGLWKNVAGRYEIDGKKVYAKAILKDPEQYFTPEVMEQLDVIARKEFSYGES